MNDNLKTFARSTVKAGVDRLLQQAQDHAEGAKDLGRLAESIARDLADVALVEDAMKRGAMLAELQGQLKLLFEIERIRLNADVLNALKDGLAVVLDVAVEGVKGLFSIAAQAGLSAAMGLVKEGQ